MTIPTEIDGNLAVLRFSRFDLDAYRTFLACKRLPESLVSYDWRSDTYTLTTPARFADRLGAAHESAPAERPPLAQHLFEGTTADNIHDMFAKGRAKPGGRSS